MEADRFDTLTRALTGGWTRRLLVGGLAGVLGLRWPVAMPDAAGAKKKKKLKFNEFGCVNVGGKCRGKGANCCSGICQGKKPKKGKKDKSRCVAHDESTCVAGQNIVQCGGAADVPCITSAGTNGSCATTTGNAGFCFDFLNGSFIGCKRDADCLAAGPNAACVACPGLGVTACATFGVT